MEERTQFWKYVWAMRGSVSLLVMPRVLIFGATSMLVVLLNEFVPKTGMGIGPVEVGGGALVLLLVFRTNAGYERWWEGRKLWGGIVNQCRNLALTSLSYGPADRQWRERLVRWVIAFSHVARRSLRNERDLPEVAALLGDEAAQRIAKANHMPSYVIFTVARLLREASERYGMDRFAFLQADRERAILIDHIGACERILKTPLPLVYAIKIRRFVAMYLLLAPFGIVDRAGWATPLLTLLLAYAVLGIDQIGVEMENPFNPANLSHLPLDQISQTIEANLLDALRAANEDIDLSGENSGRREMAVLALREPPLDGQDQGSRVASPTLSGRA